jgi:hypothetical protein
MEILRRSGWAESGARGDMAQGQGRWVRRRLKARPEGEAPQRQGGGRPGIGAPGASAEQAGRWLNEASRQGVRIMRSEESIMLGDV